MVTTFYCVYSLSHGMLVTKRRGGEGNLSEMFSKTILIYYNLNFFFILVFPKVVVLRFTNILYFYEKRFCCLVQCSAPVQFCVSQ